MTVLTYPHDFTPDANIENYTERFFEMLRFGKTSDKKRQFDNDVSCTILVNQGVCLEVRDDKGYTPLMQAVLAGYINATEALLALGARMEAQNQFGQTALIRAAWSGNAEIIKILLAAGANIEARDNEGSTALARAADNVDSTVEVVRVLIAAGANIEARDLEGYTPLIIAARDMEKDAVQALLSKGANIYANGKIGFEVMDCRIMHEDDELKRDIAAWERQYQEFITTHKAPATARITYQLLAVTPLANSKVPVDYVGNLRRIFTYAKWESREKAEGILKEMQKDGTVSAANCESILAATFPPERTQHRSQYTAMAI